MDRAHGIVIRTTDYKDKDKSDMLNVLDKVVPMVINNNSKRLNTGKISGPIVKDIEKMIEEVR